MNWGVVCYVVSVVLLVIAALRAEGDVALLIAVAILIGPTPVREAP